jgi:indolepyruvate ferredoxin oxidoreductase
MFSGGSWQAGLVPISAASIEEAVRLNGVEIERNRQIFRWGRKYQDPVVGRELVSQPEGKRPAYRERRFQLLVAYQDARYETVPGFCAREVEAREPGLRDAVARYLYKLMAHKDEYEVARLLTAPRFEEQLRQQWESIDSIGTAHSIPFAARHGNERKLRLGSVSNILRLLARLKALRGTPFVIFGYSASRRQERALISWYRGIVEEVLACITPANRTLALEIAELPDQIRGYESIRSESAKRVQQLAREKLAEMKQLSSLDRVPETLGSIQGS